MRGEGNVIVRPDVAAAVERAATALADAGYRVREVAPPGLDRAHPLFGELRVTDDYADLKRLAAGREAVLTPRIRGLLDAAPAVVDQAQTGRLLAEAAALRVRMLDFLAETPILLLPVAAVPAFPAGSSTIDVDGVRHVVDDMTILAPSRAISLLELPSLSAPAGLSRDGLPVGVQIVGRPGGEAALFRVASTLAQAFAPTGPTQA
jgi:amidase